MKRLFGTIDQEFSYASHHRSGYKVKVTQSGLWGKPPPMEDDDAYMSSALTFEGGITEQPID